MGIADRGEQFPDQLVEMLFPHGIEVVLAVAPGFDDAGNAQQGQVVADGRLALAQLVAQGADVQFAFAKQVHQNLQPGFIGEQLEDLDQVFFQLLGQFGERSAGPFGVRRFNGRDHVFFLTL